MLIPHTSLGLVFKGWRGLGQGGCRAGRKWSHKRDTQGPGSGLGTLGNITVPFAPPYPTCSLTYACAERPQSSWAPATQR